MITRENKIKIFAEYLNCKAIKGKEEFNVELSNIEFLVDNGFKLNLKSVYDLTQDEMFNISEEMRYNRCLQESFRDFKENEFRVSSESRNKKNLRTAMIHYVAQTDDGLKGNWFRLINSNSADELKAKSYDIGSCWAYVIKGNFKERMSLEDFGLAVVS